MVSCPALAQVKSYKYSCVTGQEIASTQLLLDPLGAMLCVGAVFRVSRRHVMSLHAKLNDQS